MDFSIIHLPDVEDSAAKFGYGEMQESRFPRTALSAEATGLAYHRVKPNQHQPFGHRHHEAEELHVVLAGSGWIKLDDERHEVRALDAIRVGPGVARGFEAGPDGLEYVVFGPHHEGESDMLRDFFE
jgi:quercetin dioxygenase-like cupin family protein